MKKYLIILLSVFCVFSFAKETRITIRAKAKDAKFIGSSLGGAYVIVRNKINNTILAEGKTSGSTGNTDLIMKAPKHRDSSIVDDATGKFLATVNIDEPTFVSIEVFSPFNHKQAQAKVSTEIWLIPGKDILGDGIILEIPGFIIDILKPRTHQYIGLSSISGKPFQIQANIVMMCGCVIDKGGVWDSDKFETKALVNKDGKRVSEINLSLVSTNLFEGNTSISAPGNYEIIVYAFDPKTGNTGVDKINYVVY
ncbi:hypothetical protein MTQ00_02930 [Chryseobacterium sp. B21-037]|uniref:hypothetical protein n=1 Tax=unclassified Chryseobacterium TaxID=2593645 RepID=UPI001556A2F1|nr:MULTISPECIES: hypothetical protein [unclassified Chryseobacterium]MDC8103484.1 hypothetical protein [Chryseobacterium sp. B21-037]WBV57014.1 hypothetical protein PFY10_00985 [Chryseobacterium daecheongense]